MYMYNFASNVKQKKSSPEIKMEWIFKFNIWHFGQSSPSGSWVMSFVVMTEVRLCKASLRRNISWIFTCLRGNDGSKGAALKWRCLKCAGMSVVFDVMHHIQQMFFYIRVYRESLSSLHTRRELGGSSFTNDIPIQ